MMTNPAPRVVALAAVVPALLAAGCTMPAGQREEGATRAAARPPAAAGASTARKSSAEAGQNNGQGHLCPAGANVLACRLANYGEFQGAAWTHLPSIGIKYVFMNVPPPDQLEATTKRLARHGLTAAVLRGDTDLSKASCIDELALQLETCSRMGVRFMFLSAKRRGADKQVVYHRLRQAGDIAAKHEVTIALETHPDLATNGDVALETMKQINHPNVRMNFDTANIHYYNRNTDAPTELKKIINYVATVELKDHNGRYKAWDFPALGRGVVDIPQVLRILEKHGYSGPLTIEVEGIKGVQMDEAETKAYIAESAAYVRSLGEFR